jgi:DNA helicase-2/ATP-dependent DNA helicase PcrA
MGVIYTKHAFVENITRYLSLRKIPLNIKKRINVLDEPDVIKVYRILEYLDMEREEPHSGESILFEILHYNMWNLSPTDLASLSMYCKSSSTAEEPHRRIYKKWREVMQNHDDLKCTHIKHKEDVYRVSSILENWITDSYNMTIQTLIEKIITESHLLDHMLQSEDKAYRLQSFNTFFDFIKNEAAKKGQLSVKEAVELIKVMKEEEIALEVNRIFSNKEGVNFMTVHGSKGLEFKHVFIMRCNENAWEKRKGSSQNFPFPPGLVASSDLGTEEDERRLFFVALTRAKDNIYISYISKDDKEKDLQMSKFVSEIRDVNQEIFKPSLGEDVVLPYKADLMRYKMGQPVLLDHTLIDRVLENFKLSTTSLNKYLKCPLSFYFENILGVPRGRNAHMGFGSAIHYALEQFFMDIENSQPRSMGSAQKLTDFFVRGMDIYKSHFTSQEFDRLSEYGVDTLQEYYRENHDTWLKIPQYRTELNIPLVHFEGIPLTGKLDRVNIYKDYVTVTDYKTGKYSNSKTKLKGVSEKDPQGGDYWRQIVFYRILLDNYKGAQYNMTQGVMDFVEKEDNKFQQAEILADFSDIESVGDQIRQTYQNIREHRFSEGCGDKNCTWCNFVQRNMPAQITDSDEE